MAKYSNSHNLRETKFIWLKTSELSVHGWLIRLWRRRASWHQECVAEQRWQPGVEWEGQGQDTFLPLSATIYSFKTSIQ